MYNILVIVFTLEIHHFGSVLGWSIGEISKVLL